MPDPKIEWRNPIKERLEREDMLARRENIYIPEFHVGSILSVTSSDHHAAGKICKFVGICIDRERCGLRARFILRNVLDHQAVEVLFDMYDPTMQKIEVLRLEKRLDDKLFYLRDALPEYSTFNVNMEPETLPEGSLVPVNETRVKLKSRPWLERWERQNLNGVENIHEHIYDIHRKRANDRATPWEKYDTMKEYRRSIPEPDQNAIFAQIFSRLQQLKIKNNFKKRTLKPIKLA